MLMLKQIRRSSVLSVLGLLALAGLLAGDAHAYRDVQIIGETLLPGESVEGVFDIVNPGSECVLFVVCDEGGFQVGEETLVLARAYFVFADLGMVEASIMLGPDGGPNQSADVDRFVFLLGLETLELSTEMRGDLNEDGQLAWRLTNMTGIEPGLVSTATFSGDPRDCPDGSGGYHLSVAKLEAAVPEPSAALLFCLGFGVVGTATRARRKP